MARSKRNKSPDNCDGRCAGCKLGKKCPEYVPGFDGKREKKVWEIEDDGYSTAYETSQGYLE